MKMVLRLSKYWTTKSAIFELIFVTMAASAGWKIRQCWFIDLMQCDLNELIAFISDHLVHELLENNVLFKLESQDV
jgi:hypothetical protein